WSLQQADRIDARRLHEEDLTSSKEGPGERPRIRSPRYVVCQRTRAIHPRIPGPEGSTPDRTAERRHPERGLDNSSRCTYNKVSSAACQASTAGGGKGSPRGSRCSSSSVPQRSCCIPPGKWAAKSRECG